jgi:hypothetical protein
MADWIYIQGQATSLGGSATSVTLSSNITNGDYILGGVLLDTNRTLGTITDNKGNSYAIASAHDDGTLYTAVYYSLNPITNGPNVISANSVGAGATTDFWLIADEFTPPTGVSNVVVNGILQWSSTSALNVGNLTTTNPDSLAYANFMSTGNATSGPGWTNAQPNTNPRLTEYQIVTTPATIAVTISSQTGNSWGNAIGFGAPPGPVIAPTGGISGQRRISHGPKNAWSSPWVQA